MADDRASLEEAQRHRDAALQRLSQNQSKMAMCDSRIQKAEARQRELEHVPEERASFRSAQEEQKRWTHARTNASARHEFAKLDSRQSQRDVDLAIERDAKGSTDRARQLREIDRDRRAGVHLENGGYDSGDPELRARMNTALQYHDKHGSSPGEVQAWVQGTDMHKPVRVRESEPGEEFHAKSSGSPGLYAAGSGESGDRTGISTQGRAHHVGRSSERVTYLESTAAPIRDNFTDKRKYEHEERREGGKRTGGVQHEGSVVETRGGATQRFVGRTERHKISYQTSTQAREAHESAQKRARAERQWSAISTPKKSEPERSR